MKIIKNEFMTLSRHVQGLFQEYLLSCFLSNMRDLVKFAVLSERLSSIFEALRSEKFEKDRSGSLMKEPQGEFYVTLFVQRRRCHVSTR